MRRYDGLFCLIFFYLSAQAFVAGILFLSTFQKDRAPCEVPRSRLFRMTFPVKPIACSFTRWLEKEE